MKKESFTPTLADLNKISGSKINLINKLSRLSPLFIPALAALWVASTGHWKGAEESVGREELSEAKSNLVYSSAWIFAWLLVFGLLFYSVTRELPEMIIT